MTGQSRDNALDHLVVVVFENRSFSTGYGHTPAAGPAMAQHRSPAPPAARPGGRTELAKVVEQREQQLVEPSEADFALELRARRTQDGRPGRGRGISQDVQPRGHAHAGLPVQQYRSAANRGLLEEPPQEPKLPVTAQNLCGPWPATTGQLS